MKQLILSAFFAILYFSSNSLYATDWQFAGNLKLLLSETLFSSMDAATIDNERLQHDHLLSTRLMTSYKKRNISFDIHYDLNTRYSTVNMTSEDDESTQVFDLQRNLVEKNNIIYANRIDRLVLSYTHENWFFKTGRQAISWGNGFLFNPLDLINPYSQTAIDKEYKSGDDMIYVQMLRDNGDDLQWVFVPRRDETSGDLSKSDSSLLVKYKSINHSINFDLLAGRHYNDDIVGVGLLTAIKDSIWRVDASLTQLQDKSLAVMLMTNVDYSWVMLNKNTYGYLEYMYNSIGVDNFEDLQTSPLLSRLERSDVFTLGRHYLTAGLLLETNPLVNISSNFILNLSDQSLLIPVSINYNWTQNLNLLVGGIFSLGGNDTEFGGYELSNGLTLSPGQTVYGQLAFYF